MVQCLNCCTNVLALPLSKNDCNIPCSAKLMDKATVCLFLIFPQSNLVYGSFAMKVK